MLTCGGMGGIANLACLTSSIRNRGSRARVDQDADSIVNLAPRGKRIPVLPQFSVNERAVTRCRCLFAGFSLAVVSVSITACRRPEAAHALSPAEEARWKSDSAEYVRQLEQFSPLKQRSWASDSADFMRRLDRWQRDSAVIDSIVRTIDTDSLRALYRAAWTLPQAALAVQEIVCEQARLAWKYGDAAVGIVQRTIEREEWDADQQKIDRHMARRLPAATTFELSNERCHRTGPRAPDSLNGTPLNVSSPRPIPPRRPK